MLSSNQFCIITIRFFNYYKAKVIYTKNLSRLRVWRHYFLCSISKVCQDILDMVINWFSCAFNKQLQILIERNTLKFDKGIK